MNPVYYEQAELFRPERWPKKPYCSDNLENGLVIRSLERAITKPYIQANPPHLRVWSIFDIDRAGGGIAWEGANLPPPSWAAVNKDNGHAHIVYGLTAPVLVKIEDARSGPLRYLVAVEAAFRAALSADAGYAGIITKNPVHPLWRTLRGPRESYELGDLAEYVNLEKFKPKHTTKPEEIGLGRNCICFEWLRHWAYRNVRRHKTPDSRNFVSWLSECYDKALERNADFKNPMDHREVHHIAKSVARWVWVRFDIEASDAKFSQLQAHRGRIGGLKKGVANEEKRTAAAQMAAYGMSQREIAAELGVSQGAVMNWLRVNRKP